MRCAVELRGVVKSFHAGAGSCRASSTVLRGIDLTLEEGELVSVSGARGAGTSTLLLCAAGLLVPDAGHIAWFGDRTRAAAVERARYIAAGSVPNPFRQANAPITPNSRSTAVRCALPILLVDAPLGLDAPARAWLARRRSRGHAIVLATHDASVAARDVDRSFQLRDGLLHPGQAANARVAEQEWREAARIR